MSDVFNEAEKLAGAHKKQVDEGLDKAAQEADQHTGGKYDKEIDSGVQAAENHIGDDKPNN